MQKLAELKGPATWESYLNLNYFLPEAEMYASTAAKYRYETLYNQINGIPGSEEEQSELANLMKKLHPSLAGHRPPRPKKKQGLLHLLKSLEENFKLLPKTITQKLRRAWQTCYARMRRFFGSRRSMFRNWRYIINYCTVLFPPSRYLFILNDADSSSFSNTLC